MEFAYRPEQWAVMFAAVAGASAALTGLLFVGLTVNIRAILSDPAHLARGRESLGGTLVLLVLSIIVLIPGQGRMALGWELILYFVILLGLSVRLQSRTLLRLHPNRRSRWVARTSIFNFGTLAVLLAGVGLVTHALGGLLWLVVTIIIYFLWSALNAWTLVTRPSLEED
jgi:modulator of FtsH protease